MLTRASFCPRRENAPSLSVLGSPGAQPPAATCRKAGHWGIPHLPQRLLRNTVWSQGHETTVLGITAPVTKAFLGRHSPHGLRIIPDPRASHTPAPPSSTMHNAPFAEAGGTKAEKVAQEYRPHELTHRQLQTLLAFGMTLFPS